MTAMQGESLPGDPYASARSFAQRTLSEQESLVEHLAGQAAKASAALREAEQGLSRLRRACVALEGDDEPMAVSDYDVEAAAVRTPPRYAVAR